MLATSINVWQSLVKGSHLPVVLISTGSHRHIKGCTSEPESNAPEPLADIEVGEHCLYEPEMAKNSLYSAAQKLNIKISIETQRDNALKVTRIK